MGVAVEFFMAGLMNWYWPEFNGFFLDPVKVTAGEAGKNSAISATCMVRQVKHRLEMFHNISYANRNAVPGLALTEANFPRA